MRGFRDNFTLGRIILAEGCRADGDDVHAVAVLGMDLVEARHLVLAVRAPRGKERHDHRLAFQ